MIPERPWVFQRKHWASEGSRRRCLHWEPWEGQAPPTWQDSYTR